MRTNTLNTGDKIPSFGLGTWLAEEGVAEAVLAALEVGYRHIDCAAIYGNEAIVGSALQSAFANDLPRADVWLTSKLWNSFHKPEDVRPACVNTLRDLGVDYLDLYLMHWPVATNNVGLSIPENGADYLPISSCPLDATFVAMQQLVDEGLVKNIGVSNFTASKLDDLIIKTGITPSVNQIECHPYLAQPELHQICAQKYICITAYSPLGASGRPQVLQTGDRPLLQDPVILEIANQVAATPAQVLLAWSLAHGNVVIPKSVKADRIKQNFAAQEISLSAEAMAAIDGLNKNQRFVHGGFFSIEGSPYTKQWLWD